MVEFLKGLVKWIIVIAIIVLLLFFFYRYSKKEAEKRKINSDLEINESVNSKTKKQTKQEIETNKETNSETTTETTTSIEETKTNEVVETPDTASNTGITLFVGLFIIGCASCYVIRKSN